MTGSGPLLGEDRPHTCDECGRPLDPDVAHVQHEDGCWLGNCYAEEGCYCEHEVCADCCQDPNCPLAMTGDPLCGNYDAAPPARATDWFGGRTRCPLCNHYCADHAACSTQSGGDGPIVDCTCDDGCHLS